MAEVGIDISGQESKTVERYLGESFAWVITVCDQAREACPVFPGADETAHWGFDDPSAATGDEAARMAGIPPGSGRDRPARPHVRPGRQPQDAPEPAAHRPELATRPTGPPTRVPGGIY